MSPYAQTMRQFTLTAVTASGIDGYAIGALMDKNDPEGKYFHNGIVPGYLDQVFHIDQEGQR